MFWKCIFYHFLRASFEDNFIYLFILFNFDCAGSSLLHGFFSSCGKQGLHSSCGVWLLIAVDSLVAEHSL